MLIRKLFTRGLLQGLLMATLAVALLAGGLATPAGAAPANGTTLAASKTLDICVQEDGSWLFSGEISVWNEGAVATQGLQIKDSIQNKTGSGQFQDAILCQEFTGPQIPAGTTLATATVFSYSCVDDPLTGDIRNIARITILNHSGSLGTPKGPEPKATWIGGEPPPCEEENECGCTYTQGYWGNKPGVVWPAGYNRTDPFFNSGMTWQGLLDATPGGNGYIILAKQYIAAILNKANNACVPSGVQIIIDLATDFFTGAGTPSGACPQNSSCGLQKTWGGILDTYNNGTYPGGPAHCGDE
jgi:hypothetical protein